MIHVTSLRVELSEQVTTPKISIYATLTTKRLKFVGAANNFLQYSIYSLENTAIFKDL